ncbi:MAG: DUF2235 domain-containing protein [Mycobacterium sp.]|nr:DUF2235 domain-containing protein [Mycobacterium sp.]
MKNIALCFDHARDHSGPPEATNTSTLCALMHCDDDQIVWSRAVTRRAGRYHFAARRRQSSALDIARTSVTEAYEFLVEHWAPGDRLFLFGGGRGASCARALTRLLGTVGVLRGPDVAGWTAADFTQYVLSTCAMPRTRRSAADWQRLGTLAAQLTGRSDIAVDVDYLGLWDTIAVPGVPPPDPLTNIVAARHAVAIDGGYGPFGVQPLPATAAGVEEVWFRGNHADVAGGRGACAPLSDIALDWVLDGAVTAGAVVKPSARPAPSAVDALAGSGHPVALRRVPPDAAVHASVQGYLRVHPSYWRRLPAQVVWADPEWEARSERLMPAPTTPMLAAAS